MTDQTSDAQRLGSQDCNPDTAHSDCLRVTNGTGVVPDAVGSPKSFEVLPPPFQALLCHK